MSFVAPFSSMDSRLLDIWCNVGVTDFACHRYRANEHNFQIIFFGVLIGTDIFNDHGFPRLEVVHFATMQDPHDVHPR